MRLHATVVALACLSLSASSRTVQKGTDRKQAGGAEPSSQLLVELLKTEPARLAKPNPSAPFKALTRLLCSYVNPAAAWQTGLPLTVARTSAGFARANSAQMTADFEFLNRGKEKRLVPILHDKCIPCGDSPGSSLPKTELTRREQLKLLEMGMLPCCASLLCGSQPANALASLATPPADIVKKYEFEHIDVLECDIVRRASKKIWRKLDKDDFQYGELLRPYKDEVFGKAFKALPTDRDAVVVELGMGPWANGEFYGRKDKLDVIGIEPVDGFKKYAMKSARPFIAGGSSVRFVHGIGEALPLPDNCADLVVSTITLCSVTNTKRVCAEVKRVLKPGGQFVFVEHVRSETDEVLARKQDEDREKGDKPDGCKVNKRTREFIEKTNFAKLDCQSFDLPQMNLLAPHIYGIATA